MFGIPAGELALLALAIVIGGVLTGLLAGVFGVGGGAIIVPVLYEIFRILGRVRRYPRAALRRHLARDHHSDLDPVLSRASRARDVCRWAC